MHSSLWKTGYTPIHPPAKSSTLLNPYFSTSVILIKTNIVRSQLTITINSKVEISDTTSVARKVDQKVAKFSKLFWNRFRTYFNRFKPISKSSQNSQVAKSTFWSQFYIKRSQILKKLPNLATQDKTKDLLFWAHHLWDWNGAAEELRCNIFVCEVGASLWGPDHVVRGGGCHLGWEVVHAQLEVVLEPFSCFIHIFLWFIIAGVLLKIFYYFITYSKWIFKISFYIVFY